MDLKVVSVMSVPMCGWNPHWGCHSSALLPYRLADQIIAYGAWWDHGVSNAFEDVVARGDVDWILTMDYDSMFTAEHVGALFKRFGDNPHIDALAALQPRRGSEETVILSRGGDSEVTFGSEAIQCDTAHFGLTLIRVDALSRMPKPWFVCHPDPNGSYKSKSRLDSDMYFWHKWKDAGNTLYVDPHICIGHLQPMVAEMYRDPSDGYMKTRHVHTMDWRKRSSPVTSEVGT